MSNEIERRMISVYREQVIKWNQFANRYLPESNNDRDLISELDKLIKSLTDEVEKLKSGEFNAYYEGFCTALSATKDCWPEGVLSHVDLQDLLYFINKNKGVYGHLTSDILNFTGVVL